MAAKFQHSNTYHQLLLNFAAQQAVQASRIWCDTHLIQQDLSLPSSLLLIRCSQGAHQPAPLADNELAVRQSLRSTRSHCVHQKQHEGDARKHSSKIGPAAGEPASAGHIWLPVPMPLAVWCSVEDTEHLDHATAGHLAADEVSRSVHPKLTSTGTNSSRQGCSH